MTLSATPPSAAPGIIDTLPLNALRSGVQATIVHLHTPQDDGDREVLLRLTEIGFLPGETVRIVARAGGGREPIAVRLGGQSTFALRRREAVLVRVQPEAGAAA
jgi:ferrous iron transport protein A